MERRIDYAKAARDGLRTMLDMETYVRACGLERPLLHLVKLRASQINGCAYCVDLHAREARADGESEQRLSAVVVWREAPFFSERERAALAWTDAVTRLGEAGVPDDLYDYAREHFSEKELVDLTLALVAINGWNRLAIAFRTPVVARPGAVATAG